MHVFKNISDRQEKLFLVEATHVLLHHQLINDTNGYTVRFLRGHKCEFAQDFFNELSAALQLPLYFGQNWDALIDCMRDLKEQLQSDLVIVIFFADNLLTKEDTELLEVFNRVCQIMVDEWSAALSNDETYSLKIILQEHLSGFSSLQDKLKDSETKWHTISG